MEVIPNCEVQMALVTSHASLYDDYESNLLLVSSNEDYACSYDIRPGRQDVAGKCVILLVVEESCRSNPCDLISLDCDLIHMFRVMKINDLP